MGGKMNIIQVVGYKNSGKTTLVEKIIRYFTKNGLQIGSIKHHGHGGKLESVEGTDSVRHQKAGALLSTVQGDGEVQLFAHGEEWSLAKIVQLYEFLNVRKVIIEGYKKEGYPKIVLIKNDNDLNMLDELSNIIAVICWDNVVFKNNNGIPTFYLEEDERFIHWLWEEVSKENE
ncbi:molybdopterin-guanine dinucleotide biosynthesis protein B [Sutcliffiella cohnii]|uniref:Molybdopterin-guanine dinucleotide biosynthesis protein B n=2 Tax=Sutcliffiella cohnii TaxID=33932 RepID=A0A223KM39_9BACI|nr:molybdopterin-guanine dinucleotide biosynthesis protein B [Sutcliffiella cohnii]